MTASRPAASSVAVLTARGRRARLLLSSLRPRQWPKNALVLAPVLASSRWDRPGVVVGGLVAVVAFTLVAGAVYLTNDLRDLRRDRSHPTKRHRPLASGRLPVRWAERSAVLAAAASVSLALGADREMLAVVLVGYLAVNLAYSLGLKAVPGLELIVVAGGFVWRPLAGGVATGIPVSGWFLEVCSLAALTVAVGKRLAELEQLGGEATEHRSSLRYYRPAVLRGVRRICSVATVGCYVGWAVTRWHGTGMMVAVASTVPLALALGRYARCNDRGQGGAPEELMLSDRAMQVTGLVWLAMFAAVGHV